MNANIKTMRIIRECGLSADADTNTRYISTPNDDLRTGATTSRLHTSPIRKTLQLMACQLLGDPLKGEEFRGLLSISLCHDGGNRLSHSVNAILRDGTLSVMNGINILITQTKLKY